MRERKAKLLEMIADVGQVCGIGLTPGEECAVLIALAVIRQAPMGKLDKIARTIAAKRTDLACFWVGKQWGG